jgi:hypothetical protein
MRRRDFIRTCAGAVPGLGRVTCALAAEVRSGGGQCGTAFVWQVRPPSGPDMPALSGHTDTILDIVGRLGSRIDLAIFTEGNHFPALLGGGVIDVFRTWARSRPNDAALPLDNIVVVTLPQPMIVAMLSGHGISFGNLTLDVDRTGGFYPDIVMAGAAPLKTLHRMSILETEARLFARNRGPALVIAAGNPRGLNRLDDITREDIRIVMASESEPGARNQYVSSLQELLGKQRTQAVLARETVTFPGRLGIQHRDIPQAIAAGHADVGIIFHHLAQYYAAAYPQICGMIAVPGAARYSSTIALARVVDPLRAPAAEAFSRFFFEIARDLYPRHGFAMMSADEFGERVELG